MKYLMLVVALIAALSIFVVVFLLLTDLASFAAGALGFNYSLSAAAPMLGLSAGLGFVVAANPKAFAKNRNLSIPWRAGVFFGLLYGLVYGLGIWAIVSTIGTSRPALQAITVLVVVFTVACDALFAGISAFAGGLVWQIVVRRILFSSQR